MSWLCRDADILEEDLETLTFEPRESRVIVLEREQEVPDVARQYLITTEEEWQTWLCKDYVANEGGNSSQISLILGGRAERPWSDPSLVSKLPWSKETFSQIRARLLVHGSIVRTINRNTSCTFSHMDFDWDLGPSCKKSIVYNCRSAASWSQDMALSVTFLTESLTTNAVLFGCDAEKPDKYDKNMTLPDIIVSRLLNSDTPVYHPMLLPTIFADIERDRQIELVREKLLQLRRRVVDLAKITAEPPGPVANVIGYSSEDVISVETGGAWTIGRSLQRLREISSWPAKRLCASQSEDMQKEKGTEQSPPPSLEAKKRDQPTTMLWLEISRLRNGLGNWKRQLHKMINHVEELNATHFDWNKPSNDGAPGNLKLRQLNEAGIRIKTRLQDLVDEYEEYTRECTHIMDGMSLATQLELSHIGRIEARTNQEISRVGLDVAQMTRRDSSLMKSIAMLGMIFLPATLVTAIFSTNFFDKGGEGGGYLWVYAVTVAASTLLTVAVFYFCVLRRQQAQGDGARSDKYEPV